MTTGDASIAAVGGGSPRISLHNGLGGIASGVFFLVQKLIDDGVATGTYDYSMLDAVAPGAPLKEYLSKWTDVSLTNSLELDGVRQQDGLAAAAAIDPEADYRVDYVEF